LFVRGRRDGNAAGETRRARAAVAARSDRPYDTAGARRARHTAERETTQPHAQPPGDADPGWASPVGGARPARHPRRGRPPGTSVTASAVPRVHRPSPRPARGTCGRGKTGTQVPGAAGLPLADVVGRPGAPSADTLGGRRRKGQRPGARWRPRLWTSLWTTARKPVDNRWSRGRALGRGLWSRGGRPRGRGADQPQCCAPGVDRK